MADCSEYAGPQDAKDFKTNADTTKEIITSDELLTSPAIDGKQKKTLAGYDADIQRVVDDGTQDISDAIENTIGKSYIGAWTSGVTTFTTMNEYSDYNGITYKPKSGITLPYTAQGADPTIAPDNANVEPFSDVNSSNVGSQVVIATGTTAARSISDRFSDKIDVRDFGAVGDAYLPDGSKNPAPTNDTQAIIDAIEFAQGKMVILSGVHSITDGVAINASTPVNVVGSQNGSDKSGFSDGSFYIGDDTTATKDVSFDGVYFNPDNSLVIALQVGGSIYNATPPAGGKIKIDNCEFTNCKYGVSGGNLFESIHVTNSYFYNIGDETVEQHVSAIRIGNENNSNALAGSAFSGNRFIDIHTNGGECHAVMCRGRDYVISDNYAERVVNHRFSDGDGGEAFYATGTGCKVVNNTCIDGGVGGEGAIAMKGGDGVASGNVIKYTSTYSSQSHSGIYLGSTGNVVDGNVIDGATNYGIYADNCDRTTITNNVITCSLGMQLIQVLDTGYLVVSGNTVVADNFTIYLRPKPSTPTTITGNNLSVVTDSGGSGDKYVMLVNNATADGDVKGLTISGNSLSFIDSGIASNYWPIQVSITGSCDGLSIHSNSFYVSDNIPLTSVYGAQIVGSGVYTNTTVYGNEWQEMEINFASGRYTPVTGERIYPPSLLATSYIGQVHTGVGDKWHNFGAIV